MASIIGTLEKFATTSDNEALKSIAKVFLKNFAMGLFIPQKDMASQCFVSDSSLTQFCKKMGFSGYREYNERAKIEYENFVEFKNKNEIANSDEYFLEQINKNISDIKLSNNFRDSLKQVIKTEGELHIFPSYQSQNFGIFARDFLESKQINSKVYNFSIHSLNEIANIFKNKKIPILFIFTGSDCERLFEIYKKLSKNSNVFVITTEAQKDRIQNGTISFILRRHENDSSPYYRTIILEILFMSIFN